MVHSAVSRMAEKGAVGRKGQRAEFPEQGCPTAAVSDGQILKFRYLLQLSKDGDRPSQVLTPGEASSSYWAVQIWNWNQVTLRQGGGTVGKVLCLTQSKNRLGIPWITICGKLAKSVEMLERISYFTCFSPYLVAGERKGPLRAVRAGRLLLQLVHSYKWGENTWPSPHSPPQETPESGTNSYLLP